MPKEKTNGKFKQSPVSQYDTVTPKAKKSTGGIRKTPTFSVEPAPSIASIGYAPYKNPPNQEVYVESEFVYNEEASMSGNSNNLNSNEYEPNNSEDNDEESSNNESDNQTAYRYVAGASYYKASINGIRKRGVKMNGSTNFTNTSMTTQPSAIMTTQSNAINSTDFTRSWEQNRLALLQNEVSSLKKILVEKDHIINQKEEMIMFYQEKVCELENKLKLKHKDLDLCNKEKLISIATCIFNNYGTASDLANIVVASDTDDANKLVLISANKVFKMTQSLKMSLLSMHERKRSTTSIFRNLINNIISDPLIYANANADYLLENYPVIAACKDFMVSIRPDFTDEVLQKVLRELCSEARQRIWEKEPDRVFDIAGRKICRPSYAQQQQLELQQKTSESANSNLNKSKDINLINSTQNQIEIIQ